MLRNGRQDPGREGRSHAPGSGGTWRNGRTVGRDPHNLWGALSTNGKRSPPRPCSPGLSSAGLALRLAASERAWPAVFRTPQVPRGLRLDRQLGIGSTEGQTPGGWAAPQRSVLSPPPPRSLPGAAGVAGLPWGLRPRAQVPGAAWLPAASLPRPPAPGNRQLCPGVSGPVATTTHHPEGSRSGVRLSPPSFHRDSGPGPRSLCHSAPVARLPVCSLRGAEETTPGPAQPPPRMRLPPHPSRPSNTGFPFPPPLPKKTTCPTSVASSPVPGWAEAFASPSCWGWGLLLHTLVPARVPPLGRLGSHPVTPSHRP